MMSHPRKTSSRAWSIGVDRLALFEGHRDCHIINALADEARGLQDDLHSFGGRRRAPSHKAPLGGRERIVEIGRCRGRNGAEHAFIGRIDHGLAAGAFPADVDKSSISG